LRHLRIPKLQIYFTKLQSTYSSVSWSNSSYPNHLNGTNGIFSPVITESSLLSDLETITPTYSPGSDGLPGCVLKFCARTICKHILKLFYLSILSSVFPTIWKNSFIFALQKRVRSWMSTTIEEFLNCLQFLKHLNAL